MIMISRLAVLHYLAVSWNLSKIVSYRLNIGNKNILHGNSLLINSVTTVTSIPKESGSAGIESAIEFLNSEKAKKLMIDFCFCNEKINNEVKNANMWTGGSYIINSAICSGIFETGIQLNAECSIKGKLVQKSILVPFPFQVADETKLKNALIKMAYNTGHYLDTALIAKLPFGQNIILPNDLLFNNVPHATWVRSYIYKLAAAALNQALTDDNIKDKSRMLMSVNVPELNPAFDTYRLATMLEMVREMVLPQVYAGKKVRVCVQQSLGVGVFAGMPVALSAMRPVMETMDWCGEQTQMQTIQQQQAEGKKEGNVRFGKVGEDQIAADDDLVLLISPQNVVGGSLMSYLEDMVNAARKRNIPFVIINPLLADRPSSNDVMQIRGRAERRQLADSFQSIFCLRLLYPSSGGYMFPIRGMLFKQDFGSPYVAYSLDKDSNSNGPEVYTPVAAFPHDIIGPPDADILSNVFTNRK